MKETESIKIPIDESIDVNLLFGNLDCNLQRVREATGTEIFQREDSLILKGGDIKMAEEIIYELVAALKKGQYQAFGVHSIENRFLKKVLQFVISFKNTHSTLFVKKQ